MSQRHDITREDAVRLLGLPREETFKQDRRSEVWSVREGERVWVIKRMPCGGLWRRLMWLAHNHAIRRQARATQRLQHLGVPVVAPAWLGRIGGDAIFITPFAGLSLYHTMRLNVCNVAERRAIAQQLGQILKIFLAHGITFKDMKISNVMIERQAAGLPKVQLIDVESARHAFWFKHSRTVRMFALLDETASHHGPSRTDRWRVFRVAFDQNCGKTIQRQWLAAIRAARDTMEQHPDEA